MKVNEYELLLSKVRGIVAGKLQSCTPLPGYTVREVIRYLDAIGYHLAANAVPDTEHLF